MILAENTINSLKAKWKNLYDIYRSNLLKEKGKSGQAASKSKPWKYMQQMSFLRDDLDLEIKKYYSIIYIHILTCLLCLDKNFDKT